MRVRGALLLAALHAPLAAALQPLPSLTVVPGSVSVSGLSSGADFVVQLATTFSSLVRGVGVFAGQPFHCAVTYFPGDNLTTDEGKAAAEVNHCFGCPRGMVIGYDHCKHPPPRGDLGAGVDVAMLVEYVRAQAAAGAIEPLEHLAHGSRVWLYRGLEDRTYEGNAVNNTAAVFRAFVPPANLHYENTVGSVHSMPLAAKTCKGLPDEEDWCSECGEEGGFNACGYDGVGHALQWIYNASLVTPPAESALGNGTGSLLPFDQTQFFDPAGPDAGFSDTGHVYVPLRCASKGAPCKLHLYFHGCGAAWFYPYEMAHLNFQGWADANDIVVVFPYLMGWSERNISGTTGQQRGGCYDGYGQTGAFY